MSKEKILWSLFLVIVIVSFLHLISLPFGAEHPFNYFTEKLLFILPVLATILHAIWTLGFGRGLFLLTASAVIGFVSEVIGLSTGVLFGGSYVYKDEMFTLLQVPLLVILFWAVFIYTGYSFTTSFLYWNKKSKPSHRKNPVPDLIPLIVLDGFLIVAIDLFLDPLLVRQGLWNWTDGGAYFGVPIGNFLGWFFVAILSTTLFRYYEYAKPLPQQRIKVSIYILPVLSYALLAISFLLSALWYQMWALAVLDSLIMLPQIFVNLQAFIRFNQKYG